MNSRTLQRCVAASSARLVLATLASGVLFGCGLFSSGNQFALRASPSVPASTGELRTSEDDNGNVRLSITGEHLAPPAKIAPDATVYVAWVQPGSGSIQNVGAIKVNEDLDAELETLTPYRRFAFSVTPEPSARVTKPTHDAVFDADVDLGE